MINRIELLGFDPVKWAYLKWNLPSRVGRVRVYVRPVDNIQKLECVLNSVDSDCIVITDGAAVMTNEDKAREFYSKNPCVLIVSLPIYHDLAVDIAHKYSKELWLLRDKRGDFKIFVNQLKKWMEFNYGTMQVQEKEG